MSAPNFYKKNASNYFAFQDREMEEGYEFLINDIRDALEELGYESIDEKSDMSRNYSGMIIAQKVFSKNIWTISIDVIIRNGYYTGTNLDYDVHLIKETTDYYNFEEGNWEEIHFPEYIKKILDREINKLEKKYAKLSDSVLERTALFSNGEALYSEVSK